jgi:hypothetical protein
MFFVILIINFILEKFKKSQSLLFISLKNGITYAAIYIFLNSLTYIFTTMIFVNIIESNEPSKFEELWPIYLNSIIGSGFLTLGLFHALLKSKTIFKFRSNFRITIIIITTFIFGATIFYLYAAFNNINTVFRYLF